MGLYGYLIVAAVLLFLLSVLGRRVQNQARLERQKRSEKNRELSDIESKAARLLHEERFEEVRHVLQHGVEVARRLNEPETELRFLHNLGTALYKLEEYGEAKEVFRNVSGRLADRPAGDQFLSLARSNFQRAEREFYARTAQASLEKANKQLEAGKVSEARTLFEDAIKSARQSDKAALVARILNDFSRYYAVEKQFDKAINQLEVALETARKNCPANDPLLQTIEGNLMLFRELHQGATVEGSHTGLVAKQPVSAPAKVNHAAPVAWPEPMDTKEAERKINQLFEKGDDFLRNHQHSNAADCYAEALDLCEATVKNDVPMTASACNRLGMARMGDGYFGHARELFERAEVIMSEWPDRDKLLHESIERNLARCKGEMGF